MTKIDMARYIVAALGPTGELPSSADPRVKKVARYKDKRVLRDYEAACHILEQRRKERELTSENFRSTV